MRKIGYTLIALVLVVLLVSTAVVLASSVYGRTTTALSVTAGTGSMVNSNQYAALLLKTIWVEKALVTNIVLTVTRVSSDLTYTQAVGTVTCGAALSGNTTSFTAAYLKYGDRLVYASSISTGATVMVEYEQQEHP